MDKIIIIALCGKSCSGKDSTLKWLTKQLFGHGYVPHVLVSDTTRPPRRGEQNRIDYNFIPKLEFLQKSIKHQYLEYSKFRNWYYGTPVSALKKDVINIGVFNLEGLISLSKKKNLIVIPILLDDSLHERFMRMRDRDGKRRLEHFRRILVDWEDFLGVEKRVLKRFKYYLIIREQGVIKKTNKIMFYLRQIGVL